MRVLASVVSYSNISLPLSSQVTRWFHSVPIYSALHTFINDDIGFPSTLALADHVTPLA